MKSMHRRESSARGAPPARRSARGAARGLSVLLALLGATCRPATGQEPAATTGAPTAASWLDSLEEGDVVEGFRTVALYLDHAGGALGARLVHEHTHFTLDLLRIESVPQAFVWVTTFPDSDRGEPHTQEHLLLGKGNRGRAVASLEEMSLVESSAFTQRVRTAYHFHTTAGLAVFLDVLERRLEALLAPDYTDEEIRREVHHYDVTRDAETGALRLEEGGTVYNEMVTSFERPLTRLWWQLARTLYGPTHPLALSSGGLPEAIREMTPEHIRTFHAAHYQLGNMGMIGAFPGETDTRDLLARFDALLRRLQPEPTGATSSFLTEDDLPEPQPSEDRGVMAIEYPSREAQGSVEMMLAWPPALDLAPQERFLLELFLSTLAGDANTNLYRRFVDSETRRLDVGATSVYAESIDWPGLPVLVGLGGMSTGTIGEPDAIEVSRQVTQELQAIAGWEPGSPELADFNRRLLSNLVAQQRRLRDFVSSPPGFGIRGTGPEWIEHLRRLLERPQSRLSLTRDDDEAHVRELLTRDDNIWRQRLAAWGLLEPAPYLLMTHPSPELRDRLDDEHAQRLESELARLRELYGVADDQQALRRFHTDYDAASAALEALGADDLPRFIDNPPRTLDDLLTADEAIRPETGVPIVASTFESMSGASIGLALRLDAQSSIERVLLSALPDLLRSVGVIEDGAPIAYRDMVERIQNEILRLDVFITADFETDRVELVARGSGTTLEEARRALAWMDLVLFHPDWRPENLPRIRDTVSETLETLRRTTQRREEAWVNDPANAYRRQDNPLLLATRSFLTRTHNVQRLRWLLMESPDAPTGAAVTGFLEELAELAESHDRGFLTRLLETLGQSGGDTQDEMAVEGEMAAWQVRRDALSEPARALVNQAVVDLERTLGGIPDESLAADWHYLCRQMARDLAVPPPEVLAALDGLRGRILSTERARMFTASANDTRATLMAGLDALLSGLARGTPATDSAPAAEAPLVWARMRERLPDLERPVFVGLVNPDTQGGVFLNSAPGTTFADLDRDAMLDYLTGRMYGGGGAHSLFMKTWGAGLAYSNGVRADLVTGRIRYYAERCPELPQTLRFVIDELSAVDRDPHLAEYALSQVFESRSARDYETRSMALAADLADGRTPDQVARFREQMLRLRSEPNLSQRLYERMDAVYGRVLPGYGPPSADVEGGIYFVIGPESQLEVYEAYLRTVEGPDARLYRLYPRDFWMTGGRGEIGNGVGNDNRRR